MTLNNPYALSASTDYSVYYFESTGPNGVFPEIIQFSYYEEYKAFNVGFGVISGETIIDRFETNNGDTLKVLTTVASTVPLFLVKHPNERILASGATVSRTRLYRRTISQNLEEISKLYAIYGYTTAKNYEIFKPNQDYLHFLIQQKTT